MYNLVIPDMVKSIAIVGMQKNTGKTETLNWLLKQFKIANTIVGLTSIGIDGETVDQVTDTAKPEITISADTLFATSELHFHAKAFAAEILAVSEQRTALGRLVIARAKECGKILLSGPAQTVWLKKCLCELQNNGAEKTLIDGALFRLSSASPAVADALILATGAALSINLRELVKQTAHTVRMINLPCSCEKELFFDCAEGIWIITAQGNLQKLNSQTALAIDKVDRAEIALARTIFVAGGVTDRLIKQLLELKAIPAVVVRDFTKLFVSADNFARLQARGVEIGVISCSKLLAVTVNPYSPTGYVLNSEQIIAELAAHITVPIINIRNQADAAF
ncbi:MAG: hypothetical protein WCP79_09480 [Bacillota bacterium]